MAAARPATLQVILPLCRSSCRFPQPESLNLDRRSTGRNQHQHTGLI